MHRMTAGNPPEGGDRKKRPGRTPKTMSQLFRRWLVLTIVGGLLVVSAASAWLLTRQARTAAGQILSADLSYLTEQIRVKKAATDDLRIANAEALFQKAYSVQQLVREEPGILGNPNALAALCGELGLTNLDVTDATGTVVATWPDKPNYVGVQSFADYAVTEKYMELLVMPNARILEEPRQNIAMEQSEAYYLQFAGVARLDQTGIIQIGQPGQIYEEALAAASVASIAPGYSLQGGGFVVITCGGTVVSATSESMIGASEGEYGFLAARGTDGTFRAAWDGKDYLGRFVQDGDYGVYAFLPFGEVYRSLTNSILYMAACMLIVLLLVSFFLTRAVDRNVVLGIRRLNDCVEDVTHGELDRLADVRSTAELSMLTDGVNKMILALREFFAEKDRTISTAIAENERIETEKQAFRHEARHDALTGLYSRAAFAELCGEALAASLEAGESAAMLMLDHDCFKEVNDRYGHAAGDYVLRRTADTLTGFFRVYDIIGRFGGDEFCVFLPHVTDRSPVEQRVEDLLKKLGEAMDFEGQTITATCSVGLAFAPDSGVAWEALYKSADAALYEAKNAGRAAYRLAKGAQTARQM